MNSPSGQPPPLPAFPPPTKPNERPVQTHVGLVVMAVILFTAMAAGIFAVYQFRQPNAGMRTHLDSVSPQSSRSRNSGVIRKQRPAAAKDIAGLVPVATPTAMPNVSLTAAESSHSPPTLAKSFPEGRFVTLVSAVSVQTPSRKTITLHAGSHFALLAVENDQAVIRYYDGRKYSIPLSATDYR